MHSPTLVASRERALAAGDAPRALRPSQAGNAPEGARMAALGAPPRGTAKVPGCALDTCGKPEGLRTGTQFLSLQCMMKKQ